MSNSFSLDSLSSRESKTSPLNSVSSSSSSSHVSSPASSVQYSNTSSINSNASINSSMSSGRSTNSDRGIFKDKTILLTLDGIIDSVVVSNIEGDILFVNTAAEHMFGYSKEELLEENVSIIMPEPYRSNHPSYLKNFENGSKPKLLGVTRTLQGQRKDGSVFSLDISLGIFPFELASKKQLYVATIRELKQGSQTSSENFNAKFEELEILLKQNGLETYITLFLEEQVDIESFYLLDDDALKSMGIKTGPRIKMMNLIRNKNKENEKKKIQGQARQLSRTLSSSSSSSTTSVIFAEDLTFFEVIGRGAFGVVYRGLWHDSPVAIKKVMVPCEKEAQMLSKIKHRNIVQCFGVVSEGRDFCLVMELGKCNLKQVIHDPTVDINPMKVVDWATQIARGMNYLHTEAVQPILHRDLKPGNVLLFENNVLKITDFGLSKVRECDITEQMSTVGTFEYMAPEVIKNQPYSEKADVYSYGILIWEILTRQTPYRGLPPLSIAFGVGSGSLSLPVPSNCSEAIQNLLTTCWSRSHNERPSFKEILRFLEQSQADFKKITQHELQSLQNAWKVEFAEVYSQFRKQMDELQHKQAIQINVPIDLNEREKQLLERETRLKRTMTADLVCWFTGKKYDESTLGFCVNVHRKSTNWSSLFLSFDLISYDAFFNLKIRHSPGKDHSFSNWMPLYICEEHGLAAAGLFEESVHSIYSGEPQKGEKTTSINPKEVLSSLSLFIDEILKLITTTDKPRNVQDKLLDSFSSIHRILLYFAESYPEFTSYCSKVVKHFYSEKKTEKSLFEFLTALTIIERVSWSEYVGNAVEGLIEICWPQIISDLPHITSKIKIFSNDSASSSSSSSNSLSSLESSGSNSLKINTPNLFSIPQYPSNTNSNSNTNTSSRGETLNTFKFVCESCEILPYIFTSTLPELRRFMFYCYLLQGIARPKACTLRESCLKYDGTWGKSTTQTKEDFEWNSRLIHEVNSFEMFFANVGYTTRKGVIKILEETLHRSAIPLKT